MKYTCQVSQVRLIASCCAFKSGVGLGNKFRLDKVKCISCSTDHCVHVDIQRKWLWSLNFQRASSLTNLMATYYGLKFRKYSYTTKTLKFLKQDVDECRIKFLDGEVEVPNSTSDLIQSTSSSFKLGIQYTSKPIGMLLFISLVWKDRYLSTFESV